MKFDINKMLSADVYDHSVGKITLIETHISWVVLTGDYAYKIKKPVNFGFLDFSTLQKRLQFCHQELILNRRLTHDLYVDVVEISIHQNRFRLNQGNAIEYAIKMRQFDQSSQLDEMLAVNQIKGYHMDSIAKLIAHFHQNIETADEDTQYGDPERVYNPVVENFRQIRQQLNLKYQQYDKSLNSLGKWNEIQFSLLKAIFQQRKEDGFIRDCHGDLHCRNLIWLGDKTTIEAGKGPMAFDCIEFNDNLRWIDVINEIAFLVMDLKHNNRQKLANRLLNSYLEQTGDYEGLTVLPFYLCYRSMVRAKVAVLQLHREDESLNALLLNEFESYLELAKNYTKKKDARIIIMRGVSASGKSTVSQQIVEETGAIRIRSDVERKRHYQATGNIQSSNEINTGMYDKKISELTYHRLLVLTSQIIKAGFSVIVDAAFLQQQQIQPFLDLSSKLKCYSVIIELTAPEAILRKRIRNRKNDISDADLQVLDYQLSNWQPLKKVERTEYFSINTNEPQQLQDLFQDLAR